MDENEVGTDFEADSKWNNKLYRLYWALRYEPRRFFYWFGRFDPYLSKICGTKKRFGVFEAARAVCENPRTFDKFYFYDFQESKLKEEFYEFGDRFYFDWTGDAMTLWQWIEQKLAEQKKIIDTDKVRRVEIIDNKGRSYVNWDSSNKVEISFQDEGRTLKVFITRGEFRCSC